MSNINEPLHGPSADKTRDHLVNVPLDIAMIIARQFLDEATALNMRTADTSSVYRSHGALTSSLRMLLAALDTEAGR